MVFTDCSQSFCDRCIGGRESFVQLVNPKVSWSRSSYRNFQSHAQSFIDNATGYCDGGLLNEWSPKEHLQWNLDLTKCQGTRGIGLLYRGSVSYISKGPAGEYRS